MKEKENAPWSRGELDVYSGLDLPGDCNRFKGGKARVKINPETGRVLWCGRIDGCWMDITVCPDCFRDRYKEPFESGSDVIFKVVCT